MAWKHVADVPLDQLAHRLVDDNACRACGYLGLRGCDAHAADRLGEMSSTAALHAYAPAHRQRPPCFVIVAMFHPVLVQSLVQIGADGNVFLTSV